MAAKKNHTATSASASQSDPTVDAFMKELDHPLKKEIESVRAIVLNASPAIREGIKWNSPSFRTTDDFATLNLRARGGEERVWLILHTGATAKGLVMKGKIPDPSGLLEWLAPDRALVTFADAKDVRAKQMALEMLVREWIGKLPAGKSKHAGER